MWLVQGLEGSRFAIINKTHHALVDGVAGVDSDGALRPEPRSGADRGRMRRGAAAVPVLRELAAARGGRSSPRSPSGLRGGPCAPRPDPLRAARKVVESAEALGEVAWNFTNPAPDVPLNVEIGPPSVHVQERCPLEDFKQIKDVLGGTVNDVVLTVVSGALRRWLDRAGSAPRAWSCGRWCPSRSGPRASTASSATRSPRCAALSPSTSPTR